MSDSPPDADILAMQRLAEGDELALNEIMNRWENKVAGFLQRMTGDPDAAVDLTQETFVRLYQQRGSYSATAAFPTYLFHIASNLGRNHLRWIKRHPTILLEEGPDSPVQAATTESSPDVRATEAEFLRAVEAALATLQPEMRQAMLLFTYEDMSYAEIARVSQCSVKAVETRIYRARQILKSLLKDLDA